VSPDASNAAPATILSVAGIFARDTLTESLELRHYQLFVLMPNKDGKGARPQHPG
jgi:hypothetical protein